MVYRDYQKAVDRDACRDPFLLLLDTLALFPFWGHICHPILIGFAKEILPVHQKKAT